MVMHVLPSVCMEKLINNTTHMRIWGKKMIRKGLVVAVILLFVGISIIPSVIGTEQSSPVGYGQGKVYGLFPSVSEEGISCFIIGPFLGWTTLSLTRFNGHIGIIFLSGEYQWFENGPPALP